MRALAVLVAAALCLLGPVHAAAAGGGSTSISKSGQIEVVATTDGPGGSAGNGAWGGSSRFDGCKFFARLTADDLLAFAGPLGLSTGDLGDFRDNPPANGWSFGVCPQPILGNARYSYWPTGSPVPVEVVDAAIQQAVDRVQIPFPNPQAAPRASRDVPAITQLPTWVWPGFEWVPVSATASVGPVQVTATATPTSVRVDPGDGATAFDCVEPTPYVGQTDPAGACTHTYTQTTGGVPYDMFISVVWEFDYACSGSPGCGARATINPFVASQSRSVWVAQIRPVITE